MPAVCAFADIDGLRGLLLADPDALARSFVKQILMYATGTDIHYSDRRAIDAEPECAAAHNNAGLVHSQKRDSAKAIAAFRRAIALDETNADYHVNLAAELLSSGAVDEADKACMSALRLAPWDRQAAALRNEIRARGRSTNHRSK